MPVLYGLLDLEIDGAPDDEADDVAEGTALVRGAALTLVSKVGFKYIFPTSKAQLEVLAELLNSKERWADHY